MKKLASVVLTILTHWLAMSPLYADEALRLMPGVERRWIAEAIEMHGMQSSIMALVHREDRATVARFYDGEWRRFGRVDHSQQGNTLTLAAGGASRFLSLQLQTCERGTCGVLIDSDLQQEQLERDEAAPRFAVGDAGSSRSASGRAADSASRSLRWPPAIDVLSVEHHDDQGRAASTWTLHSRRPVDPTAASLRQTWVNEGWMLVSDAPMRTHARGRRLEFEAAGQRISTWIARDRRWANRTLVFVVHEQALQAVR